MRVLFQGDSITDGGRSRNNDLNHVLGHGYAYIIASRLGNELAERRPQFFNRGISGNRVSDLYARWNEDAFHLRPDLISILIGVNDAGRIVNGEPTGATDRFERAYRHLLAETQEVLPAAGLVLCEPFILRTGVVGEKWEAWHERVARYQETVHRLADEFEAVFVPLQATFDAACGRADASYWLWDGVHPTAAGHDLLAGQWLSVVQQSRLAIC
ncbi:SGNH/GDSL hydrolase family protein [Paenibacillus sp. P25]|nr:SGNH/GDSL hydrolase family protein [Paenibacillus sp. P25]